MRVCLINTPTGSEFTDPVEFETKQIRRISCEPQLGYLTLASILEANGCTPSLVDLNRLFYSTSGADLHEFAEIAAAHIAAHEADLYGFSTICGSYPLTVRIAKAVKASRPNCKVVFGGPQASVVSDQTLAAFPFVDFILRGEADQSLISFMEELSGGGRFERVPGLTHRSVFGIQHNPDGVPIPDLDALPMPAYHLTDDLQGATSASLELGRGCPFACTFCSTNDFFRRKFRLRSPQRVLADMRAIRAGYGISDFTLVHDMFTVDARRVAAFCNTLLESGERFTWSCSARTDCVDEGLIELMAAAGCRGIFFGVETGSQRMQKIIDKHLDTRRAHQVIDMVERAGIGSTVSLITGFPQETREDLSDTLDMFLHSTRTPKSEPQLNLLAPLANTPLHREFRHAMTLDELCSEISHQGRNQHEEDRELIRKYPDIFPNFYLLPTFHLDRAMLLELREFLLMAQARFRWLLAAVQQATDSFLDLFLAWVSYRQSLQPLQAGPDLRQYYRLPEFVNDFIGFLRGHNAGASPLVSGLVEFEKALFTAEAPQKPPASFVVPLNEGAILDWSDIPVRTRNSRVFCMKADLDLMIEAVKTRSQPGEKQGLQWYVVAQVHDAQNQVSHVSKRIGMVMKACNGHRTLSEVVNSFSAVEMRVGEAERDYAVYRLILKACSEGLLTIFRRRPEASSSQETETALPEYDPMSASASEQNQFSAQAV